MNKTSIVGVAAFALGLVTYPTLVRPNPYGKEALTAHHWKLVDAYLKHMNDPANYRTHPDGLVGTEEPFPIEPSLAYLAAVGELKHAQLVLPKVPNKSKYTRHWIKFTNERSDKVIYGSGGREYVELEPSGEPPMKFQLWFRPEATKDVRQLIDELESMAAKDRD
jgi:hypothetical protein